MISINDKAAIAAQAAEAAAEQGKYWEIHDLLYQQQAVWVGLSVEDFEQWIAAQAASLGLNVDQFNTDMKREDIVTRVQEPWEGGKKMGLPGTPLVLLNGQIYGGPRDYGSINDILQLIIPRILKAAVDDLTRLQVSLTDLSIYALVIAALAVWIGAFRYVWRICLLGTSRRVLKERVTWENPGNQMNLHL